MILFAYDGLSSARTMASPSQTSTEYDAELGWVGKRSFASPDMYGPGVALHTNARGFRGKHDVEDTLPTGKGRLICSGDSFTFGHSVADADAWCALLASPRLETINMGQVGYGIDQAYLWYRRDGHTLEHTVHLLAVVTDDFRRMALDRFSGYAKPTLALEGDSLGVRGVPAPMVRGRRVARVARVVQSLRSVDLFARILNRTPVVDARVNRLTAEETRDVMARIVADLARLNAAKQSRFVLLYLPIERDFVNDAARPWRDAMRQIADSLHVPLIDLVPALRELSYADVQAFYIQQGGPLTEGMGHFTVAGNRWAADHIRDRLRALGIRGVSSQAVED